MARTKQAPRKAKNPAEKAAPATTAVEETAKKDAQAPAVVEETIAISADAIKTLIEDRMYRSRQDYIEGLQLEGPAGTGAGVIPVAEAFTINNQLEAEHVDGILRAFTSERDYLHNSVGVFPAYNPDDIKRCVENEALTQVYLKSKLPTRRAPDGNTVLLFEPLPEVKGDIKRRIEAITGRQAGLAQAKTALLAALKEYNKLLDDHCQRVRASKLPLEAVPFQDLMQPHIEMMRGIIGKVKAKAAKTALTAVLDYGIELNHTYFREDHRRQTLDISLRAQATEQLVKNNITQNTYLKLFLGSMVDSRHNFLGRPQSNQLGFNNCSQMVIPFRNGGYHYTVAVVDCKGEGANRTAHIKFYDSLGHDLSTSLKNQLSQFLTERGYKVSYECVSAHDQTKEGVNCGIFASFKAIDLLNQNAGKQDQQQYLADFGAHNYLYRMNYYRYIAVLKLLSQRYNVSVGGSLSAAMQAEFTVDAKPENENARKVLTSIVDKLKETNTTLTATIEQTASAEEKQARTDLADDALSEALFKRTIELKNEVLQLLKNRQRKAQKSAADRKQITDLLAAMKVFNEFIPWYEDKVRFFLTERIKKEPNLTNSIRELAQSTKDWISEFNLTKTLIYSTLAVGGAFFAYPFALASLIKLGAFFPANPFVTVMLAAGSFVAIIEGLNFVCDKLFVSQPKKPEDAAKNEAQDATKPADAPKDTPADKVDATKKVDAANDDVVVLDKPAPTVTKQFDAQRKGRKKAAAAEFDATPAPAQDAQKKAAGGKKKR